eukprot:6191962-Pleurochrysis_carterae.AAC.2
MLGVPPKIPCFLGDLGQSTGFVTQPALKTESRLFTRAGLRWALALLNFVFGTSWLVNILATVALGESYYLMLSSLTLVIMYNAMPFVSSTIDRYTFAPAFTEVLAGYVSWTSVVWRLDWRRYNLSFEYSQSSAA